MKNPDKFYAALEADCKPVAAKPGGDSVADLVAGMEKRLAEKIDAANAEFTKKIESKEETPPDNTPVGGNETPPGNDPVGENDPNNKTEVNEND